MINKSTCLQSNPCRESKGSQFSLVFILLIGLIFLFNAVDYMTSSKIEIEGEISTASYQCSSIVDTTSISVISDKIVSFFTVDLFTDCYGNNWIETTPSSREEHTSISHNSAKEWTLYEVKNLSGHSDYVMEIDRSLWYPRFHRLSGYSLQNGELSWNIYYPPTTQIDQVLGSRELAPHEPIALPQVNGRVEKLDGFLLQIPDQYKIQTIFDGVDGSSSYVCSVFTDDCERTHLLRLDTVQTRTEYISVVAGESHLTPHYPEGLRSNASCAYYIKKETFLKNEGITEEHTTISVSNIYLPPTESLAETPYPAYVDTLKWNIIKSIPSLTQGAEGACMGELDSVSA